MNCEFFEALITSYVFDKFPELDKKIICNIMLRPGPTETTSARGIVASKVVDPEVLSVETPTHVPMVLRSPRLKPTPVREAPKPKKDKKERPMQCVSCRGSTLLPRPRRKINSQRRIK